MKGRVAQKYVEDTLLWTEEQDSKGIKFDLRFWCLLVGGGRDTLQCFLHEPCYALSRVTLRSRLSLSLSLSLGRALRDDHHRGSLERGASRSAFILKT